MNAYVLVVLAWSLGGNSVSQQEYADMASCTNAGAIVSGMTKANKIKWACIPKDNRTTK